ncbi:SPOR domain-containing protein [uncultured Nitrosomonas sp.]|uniref:SPOR domain-containing protein n=1 Tax=uncultured Nitrosomonas sp. TaxID=156424 RepID=UPI0025FB7CEE|nr:SPOR domain-containing protein [uncultured Nitrosomonas sp.]
MKIIFIILLLVNIAYVIGSQLFSEEQNGLMPTQVNPEKIVLVSAHENCLIWSDFYEEQIQYALTVLSELFPDLLYSLEESGSTTMFWLYISPFPNKEAANREINKLRNLGVVSFRVKDETQWKNAVSLGMFYDQKDALKQLRETEKKGVSNAKIEDRSVLLRKIIIHNPTQTIKEQMQKLVEQFDDTQLVQGKCERL